MIQQTKFQDDMSSFRLFRVAICGLDNMKNFSVITYVSNCRHRRKYILKYS